MESLASVEEKGDDQGAVLGLEDLHLDSADDDETSYVASSLSPDVKSPVSDVGSSSGKQLWIRFKIDGSGLFKKSDEKLRVQRSVHILLFL